MSNILGVSKLKLNNISHQFWFRKMKNGMENFENPQKDPYNEKVPLIYNETTHYKIIAGLTELAGLYEA